MRKQPFENIMEKGETAGAHTFLLCFEYGCVGKAASYLGRILCKALEKKLQDDVDRCTSCRDIAEIMLKVVLDTIQTLLLQMKSLNLFLYTGDSDVGLENCLKILDAAKTYAVQGLVDKCLNIMKASMTPESVCCVMEIGHVNHNEELRHRCLNFIVRDPQKVFASDGLVELCSDCLCLILEDERLSLNEEFIFQAALKYVESKCRIFSIEPTAENKQTLLGAARSQIRFPCMSAGFFSEAVQPSGILTDSESVKVYKYFINPASGCDLFKTTPRNMLKKASRFREIAKGWGYKRDKQDAISFTCSHDIMVKGVELFSTGEETANYEVTLMLAKLPLFAIIRTKYAIVETDSKEQTYNLMFDEPVIVQKNQKYAICLVCRGPPTYYGLGGIPLVQDGEITFHFLKNEKSTNNTNVERGQIASVLYSLLPGLT